ncbi:hypothetical protein N9N67_10595 [Bacteriovoracaceae bacterium]|nr:hypothetical protein [Bacteriovoracaceae bacterium]
MSDENTQYSILGLDIKLENSEDGPIKAERIIERFKQEIENVQKDKPGLKSHQLSVLVGLDLMKQIMTQEDEYKNSLSELKLDIKNAISFLNESKTSSLTQ